MLKLSARTLILTISVISFLFASAVGMQRPQDLGSCSLRGSSNLPGTAYAGDLYPALGRQPFDNYAWAQNQELNALFGIDAALFYMIEAGNPNAYASRGRLTDLLAKESRSNCCQDGTILLGTKLIDYEYRATKGTGLSLPAILAHEHAHILQFKNECPLQGKWRELHADYLAGWYVRYRDYRPGAGNSVYQAMYNFYYKGDYDFNSSTHHGTPEQRATAFLAGYNNYKPGGSAAAAYADGITYLNLQSLIWK